MAEWEIAVPGADDQSPAEALASNADELVEDAEDRRVAAQLLLDSHDPTIGDLRNRIETASPEERRALLDRTREAVGLPTSKVVEERQAFEFHNRPRPTQLRDAAGRVQALCSEPGCPRFEPGPLGPGSFKWVDAKRWWCEKHRAGHESDLEPYTGPRLAWSRSGVSIVDLDEAEAEAERQRAEAESRRRQREVREAQRRHDAEKLGAYERAADERMRAEHPRGLRPEGVRP